MHLTRWMWIGSVSTIVCGCNMGLLIGEVPSDGGTTMPVGSGDNGGSSITSSTSGGGDTTTTTTTGIGGAAGSGGTPLPPCDVGRNPVTKIDVLFMIDNSSSMADKQTILADAVPDLVNRLVDPPCIDPTTGGVIGSRRPDGTCETGVSDFDPVNDIHIGIITSSLGGHGATGVCDDPDPRKTNSHNDDKGHLVARTFEDAPVPTFENKGFLNWNPVANPSAQLATDLAEPFRTMLIGVGQHGCGYEAQLESIYRFLIDPDPYQTITVATNDTFPGPATPSGTDSLLLQQRADFLRPDSLVAVIAVTDENDCSVVDSGQGYFSILPATGAPPTSLLAHGTSACLTNPNDRCCTNCMGAQIPGCPDMMADPQCRKGSQTQAEDPENLRCWDQKRRYGIDFLYPVRRYIDGFRNSQVPNRANAMVKNPLYSDLGCQGATGCVPERPKDLVFFAGIVGVPWQDIAVDPSDLGKGLKTASDLASGGAWAKILGDPHNATKPIPPTDPHMIESIVPRPGLPPPSAAANADPVNGHEWDPSKANPMPNADLQYACTFPLAPVKVCTEGVDCDCFFPPGGSPSAAGNPLCQDRTTGAYSNTQSGGKAYPGLRELEVLKGIGDQAIVGSICPANVSNRTAPDYGYRPAVAAILNRIRNPLRGCTLVK